jgi:dTMP kinase
MAARGRLITIEGVDGTGKTTLAGALTEALRAHGIDARQLREPGGVELSERVRALVKDPDMRIGARAEALLYAAARAQLVEQALVPALAAGQWLILDRFVDSSLAYQGAGRRLGVEPVRELNEFATGGLSPDRTLLLRLDPALARARAEDRNAAPGDGPAGPDRLEREADDFFITVAGAYDRLASSEPERVRVIDAALPVPEVLAAALAALADLTGP